MSWTHISWNTQLHEKHFKPILPSHHSFPFLSPSSSLSSLSYSLFFIFHSTPLCFSDRSVSTSSRTPGGYQSRPRSPTKRATTTTSTPGGPTAAAAAGASRPPTAASNTAPSPVPAGHGKRQRPSKCSNKKRRLRVLLFFLFLFAWLSKSKLPRRIQKPGSFLLNWHPFPSVSKNPPLHIRVYHVRIFIEFFARVFTKTNRYVRLSVISHSTYWRQCELKARNTMPVYSRYLY